jgi:hypothetical protein
VQEPRQLVHTEWFDHALQKLGRLPRIDDLLSKELFRIAVYAELIPCAPGAKTLRLYQTKEFLREDGQLIRLLIYFVLRTDNAVELQNIESVEEEMTGSVSS